MVGCGACTSTWSLQQLHSLTQQRTPSSGVRRGLRLKRHMGYGAPTLYYSLLVPLQFNRKARVALLHTCSSHHADPRGPDEVVHISHCSRSQERGSLSLISHPTPLSPTSPFSLPSTYTGQLVGISAPVSRVSPIEDKELGALLTRVRRTEREFSGFHIKYPFTRKYDNI